MLEGKPSRPLVDREVELAELEALLEQGKPQLALLTGRRRVGKTFLLANAWTREQAFMFTAAQTSPELNRRQLLEELSTWSGEELRPEDYPTWRTIFNLMLDMCSPEPIVLVLDEFQYLASNEAGLAEVASELNAAWERKRTIRPLLMVLAGSAVSVMEALGGGGSPLYGRFHWQQRLEPFDYWNAAQMAGFETLEEQAEAYGVFGGTPRYLAALDPADSLKANLVRLMLSPRGEVRLLVETALDQEDGLRDIGTYKAILRAVASGKTNRNDIAQRSGLQNDTPLRSKLDRLVELGYLEVRVNIDAKPNDPRRYYLADQAMRFHQRFVEPNLSLLTREDPAEVWRVAVADRFSAFMGLEFERIAAQAYDRRRGQLDLPMVTEWGRWEGRDMERRSLEIDVVAPLLEDGVMTGAVKWNRKSMPIDVHFQHLQMLERCARAGRRWAHEALEGTSPLFYVSRSGFEPEFLELAERGGRRVIAWALDDLYGDHESAAAE